MEIRGTVVSSGTYTGKVRKIVDPVKYTELEAGEVLVTGMTRPQYNHLFKRAGAIVTDEGGVLGHAALVARECNVPFIAGTKNATVTLNTGDVVEVDGKQGVVRLLK